MDPPPWDYLQVICFGGSTGGSHDNHSEYSVHVWHEGALELESVKLPRGGIPTTFIGGVDLHMKSHGGVLLWLLLLCALLMWRWIEI